MSLLKRISATFSASIDDLVTRVENHDAIIESSIRECREAAANTRVRLAKVRRDGERLSRQSVETKNEIGQWERRAKECANDDEEKAIQCLKRRKQAEDRFEKIQDSLKRHGAAESKIQQQLTHIESRINEISQQRNSMRSRQSAADAMRVINRLEGDPRFGIEDTFDRWESSLIETEFHEDLELDQDTLENDFIEQEEMQELRKALKDLTNGSKESDNE